MNFQRNDFASVLYQAWLDDHAEEELAELNTALMKAFLQFGSETEDNCQCSQQITYGVVKIGQMSQK
jgi:hypothetical protein